jgi:hypothetical protein
MRVAVHERDFCELNALLAWPDRLVDVKLDPVVELLCRNGGLELGDGAA